MHKSGHRRIDGHRNTKGVVCMSIALIVFGLVVSAAPGACAPPELRLSRASAAPGKKVTVTGRYWFSGCQDSGACTNACSKSEKCDYEPAERPLNDIQLSLRGPLNEPSQDVTSLKQVNANPRFRFKTSFTVPPVEPGQYRVEARHAGGVASAHETLVVP